MSVSIAGDRLIFSTGVKADIHGWDPDQQRMKGGLPGSITTNSWLDTLSETAQNTWLTMQSGSAVRDGEQFRKLFHELKPQYSTGFFDVFFLFLESGMNRWSTATYKKVRTLYKHLREFEDHTGFGISFGKMNGDFLGRFMAFYDEKGNSRATTHKAVNIIVWFMNWATENGYNVYPEYRKFYKTLGKSKNSPSESLFLKWDELYGIRNLACSNKRMERVRDLFCFMCFTGLRYSELQSLLKEDIVNNEVIIRRKAGKPRRVPLNVTALEIHSGYKNKYYLNNTAFPALSIITMNKYLKILAVEAGLNRMVASASEPGRLVPLHTCITAGMGVNTFLANAIRLEIPIEVISGFTGVQNDARFRHIKMELEKEQIAKLDSL
ncbi:MAG: phage integrase SAM-like domain-containing protein [Bacteroidales bacterium]